MISSPAVVALGFCLSWMQCAAEFGGIGLNF